MASRTNKLLLGCAIGCGGLLLVAIIAFVGFVTWVNRPGTLLEPARLLGSDTTGYAEWRLNLDDPGTSRAVETLLSHPAFGQEIRTPFPPEIEKLVFTWQAERDRKKFRQLFPLTVAWTLRPADAPDRDLHLLSASIQNAGNHLVVADFLLGLSFGIGSSAKEFQKVPYQDEVIYRIEPRAGGAATFFIRGNDLFLTQDVETAKLAVDRLLAEQASPREATPLDALFGLTPKDQALRAALTNARGEIFRLWKRVAVNLQGSEKIEAVARSLRGATLHARFAGDGDLEGRLSLQTPTPEWARTEAGRAAAALRTGLGYEDLKLSATGSAEGDWIRIDFKVADVPGLIQRLLSKLPRLATSEEFRDRIRSGEGATKPPS